MTNDENKHTVESNQTVTDLMEQARKWVNHGNARQVVIRRENGETLFELPMIAMVVIAAVLLIFIPGGFLIALLAVIGGIFARLRVEVLHEVTDSEGTIQGEVVDTDHQA